MIEYALIFRYLQDVDHTRGLLPKIENAFIENKCYHRVIKYNSTAIVFHEDGFKLLQNLSGWSNRRVFVRDDETDGLWKCITGDPVENEVDQDQMQTYLNPRKRLDSIDEDLIAKVVFLVSCYHGEVLEAMTFMRNATYSFDDKLSLSPQKKRQYANTIREFWKDFDFTQIADKNLWLYGLIAKHSNIDDIKELYAALRQNANIKQKNA